MMPVTWPPCQHGAGHFAHQSQAAAAINQPDAGLRHRLPKARAAPI